MSRMNHKDFGPTLAHEYLVKDHNLQISLSAVRAIMIQHALWHPNGIKKKKVHRLRLRRDHKNTLLTNKVR